VDYEGKNPGFLVKATLDYINSEIGRLNAPLWIRPKKSSKPSLGKSVLVGLEARA
jgi:hypothetical protein